MNLPTTQIIFLILFFLDLAMSKNLCTFAAEKVKTC